ncbi:MAG: translocation protein TolB [Myxococcota bacterium]|nr:translocation protein TolB [Myxococcota bacterium]
MKRLGLSIASLLMVALAGLWLPNTAVSQNTPSSASKEQPLPQTGDNAPLRLEIWGGIRDLYRIAVPTLGDSALAASVQADSALDFKLSNLFQVIEPKSYLANASAEGMSIEKDPWLQVGAQGVSKCQVTKSGGQVKLECKLFEVAQGGTAVLSQTFTGGQTKPLVHKWVNKVVGYFTGQDGIFGTQLLFARSMGKGNKQIMVGDWTGPGAGRVTKNDSINLLPAFGPGGIYYTSYVEGFPWLYRTGQRAAVLKEPGLNMGATFHGDKMAVVLSKDGNSEIYMGNADGGGLRRLTNSGSIDVSPSFSPDGSQIAFVSDRHGSPQIFVMGTGGGGAKRITYKGNYNQTPCWCPKGGSGLIAFTGMEGGGFDVFTVDAGSGQMRRLTQNQGRNMDPAFSPDCRSVAFHSSRGGIFVSNAEGLNQNLVIKGGADTLRWR